MFAALGSTARLPGIALFSRYTTGNLEAEIEKFAKRPNIKRQIEEFREGVAKLKTPEDFFKNYKVMKFALSAYGMESQVQYPARIKQVLMSDPDDRRSVANRMADERYRQIMVDFGFVKEGMANLQDPKYVDFLVNGFVTTEFEKDAGNLNPAVTEALYFRRKIGKLTKTNQLYADVQLFDVVKEALAIPSSAVNMPVKQLTEQVERGFDVTRVGDSAYVDKFIKRYLAMKDMGGQQASGSALIGIFG
jgi:Protein of unknown function (DUF1217)